MRGPRLRYTVGPPGGGGAIEFMSSVLLSSAHYTWAKMPFFGKKSQKKIWPKKSPKMAQKWSKWTQNWWNKSRGGPQKIPTNPKNIEKMAKNAPTVQSENAPKRVKMGKKGLSWKPHIFRFTVSRWWQPESGLGIRAEAQKTEIL